MCAKKHVSGIMCVCVCILWVRFSIDMLFCLYLCHVGVHFTEYDKNNIRGREPLVFCEQVLMSSTMSLQSLPRPL